MFKRPFRNNRFRRKSKFNGFKKNISVSQYVNTAVLSDKAEIEVTNNFLDFAIDPKLKENITLHGYSQPTPIQDKVIPQILAGRDVVGIANTGTGKTAAFLIPLINKIIHDRSERVLVITPTRELAVQIIEELNSFSRNLNISSLLCIGGLRSGAQIYGLKRDPNFIVGTPGRLKDLIKRRVLNLNDFRSIVLDEVDRMVDIGFLEDIKYIISLLPEVRQSLFFSATIPPKINVIVQSFLTNPVTISVKVQETAENIQQEVIHTRGLNDKIEKLSLLLQQKEFVKVLVFGRTKWGVEKLSRTLQQKGFNAESIHANKNQWQRTKVLNLFKQSRLHVLVATDIAARGLDIDNVSHVINFDEPSSYNDYVHRIGRTGRAHKFGKALTFVG